MANHSESHSAHCVFIQLLDSSQGRPVQVWHFDELTTITIGRAEDSDIAIADEQVSRLHAKLVWQEGAWNLVSLGRNGTVVNDRLVSEFELADQTIFRLGPNGPTLRFHLTKTETGRSETVSNFDANMLAMLAVDETRKQEEVQQITDNVLFKDLLEKSQELKARRQTSHD
jgi:pSer/pThr/pTyr-binding forkhead associated (FHA) protein